MINTLILKNTINKLLKTLILALIALPIVLGEISCKKSSEVNNTITAADIVSITEGRIGSFPVYSGQQNNVNLNDIIGEGYNKLRGAVWSMKENSLGSRAASIHGGSASFRHDGHSKYAVFVCSSSLNKLINDMDNNAIIGTYLGKRDHSVGYENDPVANIPVNGETLWKNKLDEVSNAMFIPGFGRFGILSGFPDGTDFTVGYSNSNYNVSNKVRSSGHVHMGSELVEHLTNLGNIGGNTHKTIGTYGLQPILAFAYIIGE